MKLVIDTDAGIDDAYAILLALNAVKPAVRVLAITTTHGNTDVQHVCVNVLRLLKFVNRLDIPVHKGCATSLLGQQSSSSHYHGTDGFGDVPDPTCSNIDALLQSEHSAQALVSLASQNGGELTLLCLGPLTNIAVALKLDPDFGRRLKHCVIMGGNYKAGGNTRSNAEYNFSADPESVSVVLRQLHCRITLVTWDLSLSCPFSWEWYESFTNVNTRIGHFLKRIEEKTIRDYYKTPLEEKYVDGTAYITCDQMAAAVAIYPDVVKVSSMIHADVELHNSSTRGQLVIDWTPEKTGQPINVELVREIDKSLYTEMLLTAMNDI